jgi:hypothetical protein
VFFLFGRVYISWFGRNPYLNEQDNVSTEELTQRWKSKLSAPSENSTEFAEPVGPASPKEASR